MRTRKFLILIVCLASVALADDFKTISGKEYKNAKVNRVDPDGIVLITKSGVSKIYFVELPRETQLRFHYDAQKAASYTAEENEKIAALNGSGWPNRNSGQKKEKNIGGAAQRLHRRRITL